MRLPHAQAGGLTRAAFVDSVRTEHDQVVLVDAGGFFPETESQRDAGPFLLQTMKALGTAAANVGDKELAFGYAFLRQTVRESGMPVVSANPTTGRRRSRPSRRT